MDWSTCSIVTNMGHARLALDNPKEDYPSFLRRIDDEVSGSVAQGAPLLVRMGAKNSVAELQSLVSLYKTPVIIDNYAEQYAELLLSKNSHLYRANYEVQVASIKDLLDEHYAGKDPWQLGTWAYFQWKNQLVHVLAQPDFEALRTTRNRELITSKEQQELLDFKVAAFGMSVGNAGALALAISGISRNIKLIDGAVISGSNLNRILTGISNVGKGKALSVGQQIYEMNPYSNIAYFGLANKENIGGILDDPWGTDLVIDEIDDIEMKVRIRYEARLRRIPVIMATELADTVILDIERFDLEPNRPLLHGVMPGIERLLDRPIENYREWTKYAVNIINPDNMTIKMQESLMRIGSTIVTHPQLGSTVMMTGGILAFATKSIALNSAIKSGRYVISLERELLSDHKTRRYRRRRKRSTRVLRKAVESM